jgi:hypothetical protein
VSRCNYGLRTVTDPEGAPLASVKTIASLFDPVGFTITPVVFGPPAVIQVKRYIPLQYSLREHCA